MSVNEYFKQFWNDYVVINAWRKFVVRMKEFMVYGIYVGLQTSGSSIKVTCWSVLGGIPGWPCEVGEATAIISAWEPL